MASAMRAVDGSPPSLEIRQPHCHGAIMVLTDETMQVDGGLIVIQVPDGECARRVVGRTIIAARRDLPPASSV